MTITQLRYFGKAAELQSITATAEYFCVSQPAVSNAIHELEREYDITLFHRQGRSIRLTGPGELFLETAESLVQHVDQADKLFRQLHEVRSDCRIALTSSYSYLYLADLQQYLNQQLPSCRFYFENTLSSRMLQSLQNESLDIACMSGGVENRQGLLVHDSITNILSFCISESLCASGKAELSLEEIGAFPLALHQKGSSHNKHVRKCFEEAGLEPDIRFELNQLGAICQLVNRGVAGTFLPAEVFRDDPTVRSYRVQHSDFCYPIQIVHKKNNPQILEIVRLLLRFFRERGN